MTDTNPGGWQVRIGCLPLILLTVTAWAVLVASAAVVVAVAR